MDALSITILFMVWGPLLSRKAKAFFIPYQPGSFSIIHNFNALDRHAIPNQLHQNLLGTERQ